MCADKKARGWDRGRKRRTLLSERLRAGYFDWNNLVFSIGGRLWEVVAFER